MALLKEQMKKFILCTKDLENFTKLIKQTSILGHLSKTLWLEVLCKKVKCFEKCKKMVSWTQRHDWNIIIDIITDLDEELCSLPRTIMIYSEIRGEF